jgi:signal transduction histidine kinase
LDEVGKLAAATRAGSVVTDLNQPAYVLADRAQLTQIFLNLMVNAFDAQGGGAIAIDMDTGLSVSDGDFEADFIAAGSSLLRRRWGIADPRLSYVRVCVRDTGSGIPSEIIDKIFDPFFTTKQRDHGTGLGLAVVHSVVTSLGGVIDVESQPGCGTSFCVFLPLA